MMVDVDEQFGSMGDATNWMINNLFAGESGNVGGILKGEKGFRLETSKLVAIALWYYTIVPINTCITMNFFLAAIVDLYAAEYSDLKGRRLTQVSMIACIPFVCSMIMQCVTTANIRDRSSIAWTGTTNRAILANCKRMKM